MNDKVVIAGHVKLKNTIKAKTNLHNTINGTPSWVVNTGGGGIVYPHYSGSYIVTPSTSVQTLDTSDKVMDDNVTVQAVAQGSATTPATIITADPTISVSSGGLITATVSKTQQITPTVQEGYVETGTPGNVGVSGSQVQQLTTQAAQTIHPASTDQSIASGKYLIGNQTFKAVTVSGLTADKVLQGTTVEIGDSDDSDRIMKVVGTAQGGITPTGTKQISITQNGTTTEDVTNYASAEITVNVSGGSLPSSVLDHVTVVPIEDITNSNKLTLSLHATDRYYLIGYCADDLAPPSSGTIFMNGRRFKGINGSTPSNSNAGQVLRADGTTGSDNSWASYNESTGVMNFPNSTYSVLKSGKTYEVWLFHLGDNANA